MTILSLKGILLNQLHRVLSIDHGIWIGGFKEISHSPTDLTDVPPQLNSTQHFYRGINWQELPLTKTQDSSSVLYTSALPQKLAKKVGSKRGTSLAKFSQWIVQHLEQARQEPFNNLCLLEHKDCDSSLSRQLWFEFEIVTQPPGWIAFCLSHRGIALWLQHAQRDLHSLYEDSCLGGKQPLSQNEMDSSLLWQMQYTHARCCTLLALWQTSQPNQSRLHLRWPTGVYPLSASRPQAQHLVQALIDTADDMFWLPHRWPDRQYVLLSKRGAHLCRAFDQFYRECLYGFSQLSPTAAPAEVWQYEANFGLVGATRNVLKVLLHKHFRAEPPASL